MKLITWNLLADGLSQNEFITKRGDKQNTVWSARKPRFEKIFKKFSDQDIDVICCQENDHPFEILGFLGEEYKMVHSIKPKSVARKVKIESIYEGIFGDSKKLKAIPEPNLDEKYKKINEWFQTNRKDDKDSYLTVKNFTLKSFAQEKATPLLKYYKNNCTSPNDLYIADDGVSIYYKISKLNFIEVIMESSGVIGGKFRSVDSQKEIRIFSCHLPARLDRELRRCEFLRNVLESSNVNDDSNITQLLLMDSNISNLNKLEIPNEKEYLDEVIESYNYENLIPYKNNECFKMRHAQGNQPSKYGMFMFDTIDKILIDGKSFGSLTSKIRILDKEVDFGQKFNSDLEYEKVLKYRTDEKFRKKLKKIFCHENWGDDMNKNVVNNDVKMVYGDDHDEDDQSSPKIEKEILLKLYPNEYLPSDHPAVGVEIIF